MFYILNDGKKEKKKSSNPYRKLIKSLVDEIKSTDIDSLIRIHNVGESDNLAKIEKFALWVKFQDDNINYKEVENRLIEIYKSSCIEKMLYMYMSTLNNILYEECSGKTFVRKSTSLRAISPDHEERNLRIKSRSIVATICLYSVILEEKLLDKRMEYIDVKDNYEDTAIVKHLKSENMSLLKGIHGVPLLLTKKETIFADKLILGFKQDDDRDNLLYDINIIYSYNVLEKLVSMYCFGKELSNHIHIDELASVEDVKSKINNLCKVPMKLLHKRKVLPPTNGVILKLKNHKNIESIYIRECSRFDFRIIYGVVRYHNGRELPISLRMNGSDYAHFTCMDCIDVASTIIDFYEVPSEVLSEVESLNKPAEYEVLSPYYWKYRDKGYETLNEKELRLSKKKVKKEHEIKISTYVRNIKGTASKEARELAKKIHIVLEKNQTLVREHNRTYNKIS